MKPVVIPWAAVGFVAGAALGLAWGQKAKSRLGEAVTTQVDGARVTVTLDGAKAFKAGLPDLIDAARY